MNYIVEINAFYQHQETNPLSISARSLWHTLMQINNRAGWIKVFTVAVSTLCDKANLSESAFKRARIELVEKGYIYYKSRGGSLAAQYQMITAEEYALNETSMDSLTLSIELRDEETSEEPCKEPSKKTNLLDDNVGALVKQNKTKQITTTTTDALVFFENNFGKATPFIISELHEWNNDVECEAIRYSGKQEMSEKFNQKGTTEVLPDWFNDRKKTTKHSPLAVDDDAVREELAMLIAAYASG